ncbi:MAG: hypothetical protein IJX49_02150 [Clostridia bacterium]|nr:hypothetical protein [Clostridia bacterium]
MRKILIGILSVCALAATALGVESVRTVSVSALSDVVYVSSSGNDNNSGTNASPYLTLDKAISEIADGGTVMLQDTVVLDGWTAHNKTFTLTGGTLDAATSLDALYINDNVTFTNMTISVDPYESAYYKVYANGYKVTVGEGVTFSDLIDIYGGGYNTTVESTDLTLLSGTYRRAFGGGRSGVITGDTYLYVGGNVNSGIDSAITNHEDIYYVYGGGQQDTIEGATNITFAENAKAVYLFGGSYNSGSTLKGGANLTVTGGKAMSIYGGNCVVDSGSGSNTVVTGGTFEQIFGGNSYQTMTGDVDLRILGGTVTRRIYGGCYNDTSGLSFASDHHVTGKINLTIGSGANITYGYSGNDLSVYAHSRHSTNSSTELAHLTFADETAYNNYENGTLKLKVQDSTMKLFIGSLSVADELHYYTYTASDNVITQNCAYHTSLAATATLGMDENVSLEYTGKGIEPAVVTHSGDWEYDRLIPHYTDNVEIGTATSFITAGTATVSKTFLVVGAPTVLGGSVRLSDPSGIRFQSKIAEELVTPEATFGTLVIPKEVLGGNLLTHETASAVDIKQTKWATESVKANNPEQYEEGYAYFNAVLTDIPEAHYDKEIVARSYVCVNGQYYYSEEVTRSTAQVAAYALQDGYTDDILYTYVDRALEDATLMLDGQVTLYEGEGYSLTLSGNKGYAAIWSASDARIVAVDDKGVITALAAGKTTVTALIGTKRVQCEVIVKSLWTENF